MTRRAAPSERGSVAIELVAVVPILVLVTIVLVQGWLMVSAVQSTTQAARDAARAAARGDDGAQAAQNALPDWVEIAAPLSVGSCTVAGLSAKCSRVEVRIPYGVPGFVQAGSVAVVRTAEFPVSEE